MPRAEGLHFKRARTDYLTDNLTCS